MAKQTIEIANFLGGLAPSPYSGDITKHTDPRSAGWDLANLADVGLLRRGFGEADISNVSMITGDIRWIKTYSGSNAYAYLYEENTGSANRIHRVAVTSDHVVDTTGTFPHTIAWNASLAGNFCSGMEFGPTDSSGASLLPGKLYYTSGQYLGTYDFGTTFNDSFYCSLGVTCLGAQMRHPMAFGFGKLYVGDADPVAGTPRIGKVQLGVYTPNALPLASQQKMVKCLAWHSQNLYIGLSSNLSGSRLINCDCSVLVWDTASDTWNKEIPFPEEDIVALKSWEGILYAWGARGMYKLGYAGFEQIFTTQVGPDIESEVTISPKGILYWRGLDYAGNYGIYAYGSIDPRLDKVLFRPYSEYGGPSGALTWIGDQNLYICGYPSGNRVRRFSLGSDASHSVGAVWRSAMVKLPGSSGLITDVKVYLQSLPSGTEFVIGWSEGGGVMEDLFTVNALGTVFAKFSPSGKSADMLQVFVRHMAGPTPKIERIMVDYESTQD